MAARRGRIRRTNPPPPRMAWRADQTRKRAVTKPSRLSEAPRPIRAPDRERARASILAATADRMSMETACTVRLKVSVHIQSARPKSMPTTVERYLAPNQSVLKLVMEKDWREWKSAVPCIQRTMGSWLTASLDRTGEDVGPAWAGRARPARQIRARAATRAAASRARTDKRDRRATTLAWARADRRGRRAARDLTGPGRAAGVGAVMGWVSCRSGRARPGLAGRRWGAYRRRGPRRRCGPGRGGSGCRPGRRGRA